MRRLFIAIDPPEPIKDRIARICQDVKGARWVPKHQLHFTLRFLGDVPNAQIPGIEAALGLVEIEAFEISLTGIGQFPKGRPARVLWAGVEPANRLVALARQIEDAVVSADMPAENRSFSAHLTLARLRKASPVMVRRFLEDNADLTSEPFPVVAFQLYSSLLCSDGAQHEVLKRYALG